MEQSKKTVNKVRPQSKDSLSTTEKLMICVKHWPWFVLSFVICMGVAGFYLLSTPKTYTRTMSILVKNERASKTEEIETFEELGVGNLTSEISDEVVTIHSPAAVYDMVKRLHLDISYFRYGFFRDEPLYAETLPVEIELHDIDDNASASFTIELDADGSAALCDIELRGKSVNDCHLPLGKKCQSPLGHVILKPTLYYKKGMREKILVRRTSFQAAAQRYGSCITAAKQDGTKNIIDIVCIDNSIPRAENILKTIVNIYNENWVKNRNQISVSTNEFIKERLTVIEHELGDVDQNIAGYKSAHAMPDVSAVAAQAMEQHSAADQQRLTLSNQLYMLRYVRNYVTDPNNSKHLLPASIGIGFAAIDAQIASYNQKLLERNNLVANSSEQNPLVSDLDAELTDLRIAILNSLDNAQITLNTQLSSVQSVQNKALGRLSENPQQAIHLLSIERQQKVKENLYLFLLQKREENELSQAFTAYNTRIIADPHGSNGPTAPNSKNILLIALAIALALPAAFFIIRETMNSKIRGRKDLENLSVPYVGELPLWKPKKDAKQLSDYQIVVEQCSRDITNEAFRVVRTNLEFMIRSEKNGHVIMLTSFNQGSGKTFVSANLGASFAIRGSRVICVDLDLRVGSLSAYVNSPKRGLTNYLGGEINDYQSLIVHMPLDAVEGGSKPQSLDILPIGMVPPNPTELLCSPKLKTMLDELRQQYDYIFIDCPPVEIVADATIIGHEADITLFIVRAGRLERSMLPELEKIYEDKKYNNMAMLLNGTDAKLSVGNRYGYSYYVNNK